MSTINWQAVLDDIPAGIAVVRNGAVVFVNKRICEKMGYPREVIQNFAAKNLEKMIASEYLQRAREVLERLSSGKLDDLPYPVVIKFVNRDGIEFWNEIRFKKAESFGDDAVVLAFTDITRTIEMQEKISRMNDFLALLNKILRHDILNILTAILGYLECYREKRNDFWLEKVEELIRRGSEIITKIGEFERSREERNVSLMEAFEEILKSYPVQYEISGDGIVRDESFLSVIHNIVDNAVKHGRASEIRVEISSEDRFYRITVSDNGRGIPAEIREHVFDEGFSFGENAGSGLGLYISKKIVEECGGEMWVEENTPRGARFVIRIPAPKCEEQRVS